MPLRLRSEHSVGAMSIHSPNSHFFPKEYQKENKIPTPSHRHAAPSAPWPWINIHDSKFGLFIFRHCFITYCTFQVWTPCNLPLALPQYPLFVITRTVVGVGRAILNHAFQTGRRTKYHEVRYLTRSQIIAVKIRVLYTVPISALTGFSKMLTQSSPRMTIVTLPGIR
jgi:hypothetical protein